MEIRAFVKSLSFGALGALAVTPALILLRPILGTAEALALWSVMLAAAYVAYTAPRRHVGLRAAAALLALGLAVFFVASPATTVLASAVLLAVLRSGFLYRGRPARSVVVEAMLLVVGLSLTELFVSRGGTLALTFGVWAFFLVQSLYFLVGGITVRKATPTREDPFEVASRKAARLMEDFGPIA